MQLKKLTELLITDYQAMVNKAENSGYMPYETHRRKFNEWFNEISVESTEHKTYRNIIFEKYIVLYAVTKSTISVIDIIHFFSHGTSIFAKFKL